jgi:hypothetical protein
MEWIMEEFMVSSVELSQQMPVGAEINHKKP